MKQDYISRSVYIDRILPHLGKPVIKVLTGQRRVGKSYILRQLTDEISALFPESNIIMINAELLDFEFISNHENLCSFVKSKLKKDNINFLLIDEVQEIESFELCLRSLLAESVCDIICTGSNARLLSGELATKLAGRYIQFNIYPLGYSEFLTFHQLSDSGENLLKYLQFGGMPYLVHTGLVREVANEYLKNVNSAILLKDVVARENIRNISFLENLVAYLADNTGSLLSALNISKFLKSQNQNIPSQTVLNYLRALTNSYYVHKVQRADVSGLKILSVNEKYYFNDLGLRNTLRISDFKKDIGKLLENVVYMHLLRLGYQVFIGKMGDREIDFMADLDGERIYVQVAYILYDEKTVDREFGKLMQIPDNYPKFVVTMDEIPAGASFKGIKQMHLRDFLKMNKIQ
jgi:predicted AAA+ superfamily ATPase